MRTNIFNKVMGLAKVLPVCLFALLPLLTACSPDDFDGVDQNGLPVMEGVDVTWNIDEELNQITGTVNNLKGAYPIWLIQYSQSGKEVSYYSTLQTLSKSFTEAGTYKVTLRLGNHNGFSRAGITKEVTFAKSLVDWTSTLNRLCDKEWRIDNAVEAHLACGESGTDGTNWWKAGADEKKGTGMYDDRITFSKDGTYTYSAGEDGKTYVNKGVTKWGTQNDADDVDVTIGNQTSSFELVTDFYNVKVTDENGESHMESVQGNFIKLAANTLFPYIAADSQYENAMLRIESITANQLVLVYDIDGSIAWHFILTSKEGEKVFEGFNADSDFNLWKNATLNTTFWYAPNWAQIADPALTVNGNSYSFNLPEATYDRWQAQFAIESNIATNAATNYDFSVIINVSKDVTAMVKLVEADGPDGTKHDGNFFFADEVDLKAGEDYVFWKSDMPGIDAHAINLVFDFGRNQDDTNVEVRNVVLKDHANDDGTVLPSDEPGGDEPVQDWDAAAGSNLWKAVEDGSAFLNITTWFANGEWSELPNQPSYTHANGAYELTIPEGMGGSQWQGQFAINTSLTASQAKKYNFYCVVEADNDCPGVTIKLTETDDADGTKHDGNFFFDGRHEVKADKKFVYKAEGVSLSQNDAHALTLVIDFGGTPAGTNVKVSDIYFEEVVELNYDDAGNLWKSVDTGSNFLNVTTWFANDGWAELGNQPSYKHEGNKWELDIPEGTGSSQWQGQFAINTSLTAALADAYNFSCTILADNDAPHITIKLTETDDADGTKHDSNFYFDGQHAVQADNAFVYKATGVTLPKNDAHALTLVLDFGGTPAGTHIVVSDIIFEKAE